MNFDTNLFKFGQELRMLWKIEYFNIGGMSWWYGRRHFEYLTRFHKSLEKIF